MEDTERTCAEGTKKCEKKFGEAKSRLSLFFFNLFIFNQTCFVNGEW